MVNLAITSAPFTSSLLRSPPSPSSPRSPLHEIYFLRESQRSRFTHLQVSSDSNIPSSKYTLTGACTTQLENNPPQHPLPWIWRCHICQNSYPLNATRRCLNDGHVFCAGESNIRINPRSNRARTGAVTGKRRKRKHIPCSSEFDYSGWKVYGEWRRKEIERRLVPQLKPAKRNLLETMATRILKSTREHTISKAGRDCEGECNYPSECRWAKKNAITYAVVSEGFSHSSPCLLTDETVESVKRDMAWLCGDEGTSIESALSNLRGADDKSDFEPESNVDYELEDSVDKSELFNMADNDDDEDDNSSNSSNDSSRSSNDASEDDESAALALEIASYAQVRPRATRASAIPGLRQPTTFEALLGLHEPCVASITSETLNDVHNADTSEDEQNPISVLDEYQSNFWRFVFLDNEHSLLEPTSDLDAVCSTNAVDQDSDVSQNNEPTDRIDDASRLLDTERLMIEQHGARPSLLSPSSFSFAHALDLNLSFPPPAHQHTSSAGMEPDSSPHYPSSQRGSPERVADSSSDLNEEDQDLLALPPLSLPLLYTFASLLSVDYSEPKAEKKRASWIGDLAVKAGAWRKV